LLTSCGELTTLVANQSLIDDRQVLQVCNVIILHNEYCAPDLYYIINPQGMKAALLAFS